MYRYTCIYIYSTSLHSSCIPEHTLPTCQSRHLGYHQTMSSKAIDLHPPTYRGLSPLHSFPPWETGRNMGSFCVDLSDLPGKNAKAHAATHALQGLRPVLEIRQWTRVVQRNWHLCQMSCVFVARFLLQIMLGTLSSIMSIMDMYQTWGVPMDPRKNQTIHFGEV